MTDRCLALVILTLLALAMLLWVNAPAVEVEDITYSGGAW